MEGKFEARLKEEKNKLTRELTRKLTDQITKQQSKQNASKSKISKHSVQEPDVDVGKMREEIKIQLQDQLQDEYNSKLAEEYDKWESQGYEKLIPQIRHQCEEEFSQMLRQEVLRVEREAQNEIIQNVQEVKANTQTMLQKHMLRLNQEVDFFILFLIIFRLKMLLRKNEKILGWNV